MRKSIPVSGDLAAFFADPAPVLSDNNVRMIAEEIGRGGYDWVVEYGMGASTLYFLKAAPATPMTFISVENNFDWFEICAQEIAKQTGITETGFTRAPWSLKDIRNFAKAPRETDAPSELRRFPVWRESLLTGPFYRFAPTAKSRFSGKLGPAWPALKPLAQLAATGLYTARRASRPQNAQWRGQKNDLRLVLRNVGPSIKDQYGEAPNMMDYIDAGLREIRALLTTDQPVKALFIIDGGPRHKIVQEILELEDRYGAFRPTVILCDASRAFYHETLKARPGGTFVAGSNKTLKGAPVETGTQDSPFAEFWTGGAKTGDELAKQEVWLYRAGTHRVS